ncbi:DUF2785 domain-containing protein [Nocardioides terrisoli]|uniref:DUF2785 domain-containing protein n=1 Tax=Nocardioides terrisoli TaxID=3388267 RepID=UPI00287B95D4|nr:DUF2785 domain-containing protein [Nocardioides marmorisolisilvae]
MVSAFWQQVVADGLNVPTDRPLDEMTVELTTMLGDPDPAVRDGIGYPTLATWIEGGVYDDLLPGLGDGMAVGLERGLGESGTDAVFTRSFSALVLAECIERDTRAGLVPADRILRWGDRLMTWFLRERDLRGFVPGKGWAHAVAHGADCLGALARSPHLGRNELTVLLDVVADRLLLATDTIFTAGEPDRLAVAVMQVLRRELLDLKLLEPWVARIAAGAVPAGDADHDPFRHAGNAQAFLRSLHLQLALGVPQPQLRSDLLLVLIEHLRASNPWLFTPEDDREGASARDARTAQ